MIELDMHVSGQGRVLSENTEQEKKDVSGHYYSKKCFMGVANSAYSTFAMRYNLSGVNVCPQMKILI